LQTFIFRKHFALSFGHCVKAFQKYFAQSLKNSSKLSNILFIVSVFLNVLKLKQNILTAFWVTKLVTFTKERIAFYAVKNEAQMRQQTLFEKKDGCLCVNKNYSQNSQSEAFLHSGLFDKTNFTSSYSVTENLQVILSVLISVLSV
jgi:hypothetical protein